MILRLVNDTARNFRSRPTTDYLGSVVRLLEEKCSVHSANEVLKDIHFKFDNFPTLKEVLGVIEEKRSNITRAPEPPQEEWVSRQAPGTPAEIEALCLMYKNDKHDTGAFQYGLTYCGLSPSDMFEVYEAWLERRVHPLAKKYVRHPFILRMRCAIQHQ